MYIFSYLKKWKDLDPVFSMLMFVRTNKFLTVAYGL